LIIGDSGVGKTNLLLRFCDDKFATSHLATMGKNTHINYFWNINLTGLIINPFHFESQASTSRQRKSMLMVKKSNYKSGTLLAKSDSDKSHRTTTKVLWV